MPVMRASRSACARRSARARPSAESGESVELSSRSACRTRKIASCAAAPATPGPDTDSAARSTTASVRRPAAVGMQRSSEKVSGTFSHVSLKIARTTVPACFLIRCSPDRGRHRMGRPPRITPAGFVFHVFNRAIEGVVLFENKADFEQFYRLLVEGSCRFGVRFIAYCLMPNHWHLVLWPTTDNAVSDFLHW